MVKRDDRKKPTTTCKRSSCPIANILDLVGDKWTLLIVRDLLFTDKRRYREFAQSPEGIPTNILADRLKRLERDGLISRAPYQDNPPRYAYELTPMGRDLRPVLMSMMEWSVKHVPGSYVPRHVTGHRKTGARSKTRSKTTAR